MLQLELFSHVQAQEPEPAPEPSPVARQPVRISPTRFPILGQEERQRWVAVWPPPVALGRDFDLRLEQDSFAEELFALGPFPATDEALGETDPLPPRPASRRECASGPRPCPWVSCRHHLYLDVRADGSLKLNFPDREPEDLAVSCSLDLAEDGPRTLDAIAALMNMSKERARQLETAAFDKLYATMPRAYGADMAIEDEWV